jgi:hypothetical protein
MPILIPQSTYGDIQVNSISIIKDDNNVKLGYQALRGLTTGTYNVAIGYQSLFNNTEGIENSAVGYQALYTNQTGTSNVAVGYQALNLATGDSNTAIGLSALSVLTTGIRNVAVGQGAGYNLTTGSNNVLLGRDAIVSAASGTDQIVMGHVTTGKGNQTGFINPNGGGVYQGNNSSSWSTTSDQRLKKNIVDNNDGLNKITAITVRNFEYRLPEEITELEPSNAIQKQGIQLGVIAQELQQVLPECVKQESTGVLSVDTDNLTWYLINAVKQLKAEIDQLKGV